jgi:hypothetical protein
MWVRRFAPQVLPRRYMDERRCLSRDCLHTQQPCDRLQPIAGLLPHLPGQFPELLSLSDKGRT